MAADVELCEYLEDEGVGTVGTDIFVGEMPAGVIEAMALTQYPGAPPEHTCGSTTWNIERPRLQFRARSTGTDASIVTALQRCRDASEAFGRCTNQTVEGVRYRAVTVLQSPGLLFRDANDRPVYGFNVEAEKARSTT